MEEASPLIVIDIFPFHEMRGILRKKRRGGHEHPRRAVAALEAIMLDKGKDYVNNRGMASAVSAAYRRWKEKDPIIYYAIAYTYTDKEGNLAWEDPQPEK